MKYIIYGAGGIGGVVGARLFQAGFNTRLVARGEHQQRIRKNGLRLIAPQEDVTLAIPLEEDPQKLQLCENTAVLLCVKSQHTHEVLETLQKVPGASRAHIVCLQNGVSNEREVARRFSNVYAAVVNLPASFIHPGEVVTHAYGCGGIMDVGRYPYGLGAAVEVIADNFRSAGFSSFAEPNVMRFKYAKLLTNLFNLLQAALTDANASDSKVELKKIHGLLRQEALQCFDSAGVDCASREQVKDRHRGVYSMVEIPGHPRTGGSSWQSMQRGTGNIETAYFEWRNLFVRS